MFVPAGYVQMTSMTTASALTGIPQQACRVVLQAEAQNVRWRNDGTAPTATVGNLIRTTDPPLVLDGIDLSKVQVIAATAGAILNVTFYKGRNFTVGP